MPLPTIMSFVDSILQNNLLDVDQREAMLRLQVGAKDSHGFAREMLRCDLLTPYQINQLLQGKGAGLNIGPYVLLERVGEGGMGQVFKAKQKVLNRFVALKVIRKECLDNPKVVRRFQREIRAAGALSHPHIVRAYDADQVQGTYYIAMEFIDGEDLAKVVKDRGPLPINQACEYIRQAALGLQHAFERGLVHRDIKPANLLVMRAVASDRRRSSGLIPRPNLNAKRTSSGILPREAPLAYPWGIVKILDMGLARCTETFEHQASTHLTQIGSVMGTPEFIAPEQARDSHTSDVRADLYSLGCTLYFLLSGQPPFPDGTMTEKLLQHQVDTPASVNCVRRVNLRAFHGEEKMHGVDTRIPAVVVNLIAKLLAKLPEDRHQTPIELATDLQAILQQIADGTLAAEDDLEEITAVLPALPMATPTVMDEVVPLTDEAVRLVEREPPARRKPRIGILPIALASVGGLAMLLLTTVVAVIIGRGATQAGAVPQPNVIHKAPAVRGK